MMLLSTNTFDHSSVEFSRVQSNIQLSSVEFSRVQFSSVKFSQVQSSSVEFSRVQSVQFHLLVGDRILAIEYIRPLRPIDCQKIWGVLRRCQDFPQKKLGEGVSPDPLLNPNFYPFQSFYGTLQSGFCSHQMGDIQTLAAHDRLVAEKL
jgi:hypothetical protein